VHLAIYFPGGSIPGQDPFDDRLAWVTMHALEQAGALVVPVHYDDSVVAADRDRFESGVRREVRGALVHYQPERLTVAAKSRGTHALRLLCVEDFALPADTRFIWLTPIWRSDESWRAACSSTIPALNIVGAADHEYHDPERHGAVPGDKVEIPDADHRLEVEGDVFATLRAWQTMAEAVHRFAARV
jgi:hypothetical protein